MRHQYKIKKKLYQKGEITYIALLFDNGDSIAVDGKEIGDFAVRLYDRLIFEQGELCAVAECGTVTLHIREKIKSLYVGAFVYDPKEYKANRKAYIENRLNSQGGLKAIRIFNKDHWSTTVFGNIYAKTEEGTIALQILPDPRNQPCESDMHTVFLNDIKKAHVASIEIGFENCEGFTVFSDEILEINLELKEELEWAGRGYCRAVKGGYLVVKIGKDTDGRHRHFMLGYEGKVGRKALERRICGQKGNAVHDICSLDIRYLNTGNAFKEHELLQIDDIKSDEELDELERLEEQTGKEHYYFEGGLASRREDGSIVITFGKTGRSKNPTKSGD